MTVRRLKGAVVRAPLIRLLLDREEACIDGFAGGGGASTGIEMALGRSPDLAINHDAEALAMHAVNHPETRHIRSNIRRVSFRKECKGQRVGFAWFSPDCTFHSKARGGRPFRDRDRARRGCVGSPGKRCAARLKCGRGCSSSRTSKSSSIGRPSTKRAARCAPNAAPAIGAGSPGCRTSVTSSRRACCGRRTSDPRPRANACSSSPAATGCRLSGRRPRTARRARPPTRRRPSAWILPSRSRRFSSRRPKPRRGRSRTACPPRGGHLAPATLRRIARGVLRYVIDAQQPFIVRFAHGERDAAGKKRGRGEHSLLEPLPTQTASNEFALVAPTLINTRNGERTGQAPRVFDITQPYPTVTAQGSQGALVAALLTKYHGEKRQGDQRAHALDGPLDTLDTANRYGLVTAFLAKHNGGHEATGQTLERPIDTVVCRENKALVTSHLLKLRGGLEDHVNTAQDLRQPLPTLTAGGTHYAEVRAFLLKFYGTKKDGCRLDKPIDTVTTKDRFGLVTVMIGGEEYAIVDIGMRMLTPRELFRCQGFPTTYQIAHVRGDDGVLKPLTKRAQTRLCGNSVPPHVAAALVKANYAVAVEEGVA